MIKVQILTHCTYCDGEAYIPIGEAESYSGEAYMRYSPCPMCQGTGNAAKWISLQEFTDLLEKAALLDPFLPDYEELSHKQPTSQFLDSRESAGM